MFCLKKNYELTFSESFLDLSKFKLLSPFQTWPRHPKSTHTKERKWSASSLNMQNFFYEQRMDTTICEKINAYFEQFTAPPLDESTTIDLQARHVGLEIAETGEMLVSTQKA